MAALSTLLGCLTLASAAGAQDDDPWTADAPAEAAPEAPAPVEAEGDITETIGEDEPVADGSAVPLAPLEDEEPAARVQMSGFARESLELVYGEIMRTPPGSPLLWRDVFVSRSQLWLQASYVKPRQFEATVSGALSYALHVAKDAPQYSIGTVDLTQGELTPELHEAFLGFYWPSVDLRIGQQRIAWGRSDFQSPNDVLNARDLRDPLLSEPELRHLPTLAARADISLGSAVTLEAVVTPLFVPDRLDVYGRNWAVLQRRSFEPYQRFVGTTSLVVDPTVEGSIRELWRATELPPDNGKGLSAGARLRAELPSVDFSLYYHYGYDPTPYAQIHPEFYDYLTLNPLPSISEVGTEFPGVAPALQPVLDLIDRGVDPYSARYVRRHHVGLDVSGTFGPIVLRMDAAYETRRVFYTQLLSSFTSPAAVGVLGIEYQTGSLKDVVLLELLATHLLEGEPPPLLGYERTSAALAGTLRWSLGELWGLDLRGIVGLQPQTYVIQPALKFEPTESVAIRLGALLVSGETMSFGWYFADNDTAFLQLRYSF